MRLAYRVWGKASGRPLILQLGQRQASYSADAVFTGNDDEDDTPRKKRSSSVAKAYAHVGAFRDPARAANLISSNVIFFDPDVRGIIAVSKPAGLPKCADKSGQFGFQELLPYIKENLGLESLDLLKMPERYTSGVALLGTKPEAMAYLKKCDNYCKSNALFMDRYVGITVGFPRMKNIVEAVDLTLAKLDHKEAVIGKESKEPVISRSLSSNSKRTNKKFDVRRVNVALDILARSSAGNAALVSLHPSSISNHFVSVYLSDQLSPLLGDHMYSYRVKSMMGTPVKVGHQNSPVNSVQSLPDWILRSLGLAKGREARVPKHLHLQRTYLPDYFGKNKPLALHAPLPEFFLKTAEALSLHVDTKALKEDEEARTWRKTKETEAESRKEDAAEEPPVAETVKRIQPLKPHPNPKKEKR